MTAFLEHVRHTSLALGIPRAVVPGSDVRFESAAYGSERRARVVRHVILGDDKTVSVLAFDPHMEVHDQLAYLATAHAVLELNGKTHYYDVRLEVNRELADKCRVPNVDLIFELLAVSIDSVEKEHHLSEVQRLSGSGPTRR